MQEFRELLQTGYQIDSASAGGAMCTGTCNRCVQLFYWHLEPAHLGDCRCSTDPFAINYDLKRIFQQRPSLMRHRKLPYWTSCSSRFECGHEHLHSSSSFMPCRNMIMCYVRIQRSTYQICDATVKFCKTIVAQVKFFKPCQRP